MASPPTYIPGIGRLAADRYDFEAHIEGIEFRHNASTINVDNPGLVYGSATTVEAGLENLTAYVDAQLSNGEGFITVGEGYDTWHLASPAETGINFDPTVPSLDTLLNPIFNDIINNVTLSSTYSRIQHGGIVVIKAGTYIVQNPIVVPPGITLLGEGYGTKIVNASALYLNTLGLAPQSVSPYPITTFSGTPTSVTMGIGSNTALPNLTNGQTINIYNSGQTSVNGTWTVSNVVVGVSSITFTLVGSTGGVSGSTGIVTTCRPVFTIAPDTNRSNNDAAVSTTLFMFSQDTRIMNMVIADNFVEAPIFGNTNYKQPQKAINLDITSATVSPATSIMVPALIDQMAGSSLILDNVYLLGRTILFAGKVFDITSSLITLDNSAGTGTTGSILRVTDSFLDGSAFPISFLNVAGSLDYLEVTNSKIRAYGFSPTVSSANTGVGTFVFANDTNAKISGNTLYAATFYTVPYLTSCIYYVNTSLVSLPAFNGRSRVIIEGNNLNVDKTLNTVETLTLINDPNGLISSAGYITSLTYGNAFADTFEVLVDKVASPANNVPKSISSGASPYTITISDSFLLAHVTSGAITLNLPAISSLPSPNQRIIIKDTGGANPDLPIYIVPAGSDTIDRVLTSYTITAPYTSITLQAVTTPYNSWFVL